MTAVGIIAASAAGCAAHVQTRIVEGFVSHGALQWPEYAATDFGCADCRPIAKEDITDDQTPIV